MSVKGLSDYDQYGNKEHDPVWPFRCELRPNDPCGFPDEWHGSYLDTLTTGCIPMDYPLWDVHCMEKPEALGGELIKIGEIITTFIAEKEANSCEVTCKALFGEFDSQH